MKVLGLDIGTNSLGWAIIEDNKKILGTGVVIFPIGTNVDEKGRERTKNQQRREYRSAKRLLYRYKMRRAKLQALLTKLCLIPKFDGHGNLIKTYRIKEAFQGRELYRTRTEALERALDLEDIGRIFLLMNKYRGFKSGSKTLTEDTLNSKPDEEEGMIMHNINELSLLMQKNNARTIGEYYYMMFLKAAALYEQGKWHNPEEPYDERAVKDNVHKLTANRGLRREFGRHTSRQMNEQEFDMIWAAQKKYHAQKHSDVFTGSREEYELLKERIKLMTREERKNAIAEFKKTNYWQLRHAIIFYQRPLKSPKRYIGRCLFERNKRAAPISSFLYQEFRIWKQLSDIRYSISQKGIEDSPLPDDWKNLLWNYLQTTPALYFKGRTIKEKKHTGIAELLGLNPKHISFNFADPEGDSTIRGNITSSRLFQSLGSGIYNELLRTSKLEKLWHLIYMKRDNEWLSITLNDKMQWPELNDEVVHKLCEIDFEEGYGSYCTKALKKILPHLKSGLDERHSLEEAGYKEKDEREALRNWHAKPRISQIRTGELRNPVVEKAVTQAIKLVNAVIHNYSIDTSDWAVRIESTRELKKPRKERENMRRVTMEKDKLRKEYADFLNEKRKEGKLPLLKRDITKSDSIINKFELWLELGGDKHDAAFDEFSKAAHLNDNLKRIKYKLWLECNRICPYTGNPISLADMLSPNIEIEHIIPLSRGLDNSFTNKTLTFSNVNKEKKNRTAFEFMQPSIKEFTKRVKDKNTAYSKAKIENFLREKTPDNFTHDQLNNTSYIAKFVRSKLQEVCSNVYFTNGRITAELRANDWKLSSLLDKIRYEEEKPLDVDKNILQPFAVLRKDFNRLRGEKGNEPIWQTAVLASLPDNEFEEYKLKTGNDLKVLLHELEQYDTFRNKSGKKDRSDHRHHALDAVITALCSPSITQKLSTLNASREELGIDLYDEYGHLTREHILCPVEYSDIKDALSNILVVHNTPQRLLVAKKNKSRIKARDGKHYISQPSHSIRASLHKDTLYKKLKKPMAHLDIKGEPIITKPEAYATREKNYVWEFTDEKSLRDIYDRDLQEIIRRRLKRFKDQGISVSEQSYMDYPLYRYSPSKYPDIEPENPVSMEGKPLPVVKKVRTVYKNYRSVVPLPNNRYADSDGNYIMAIYELREKDKKGKDKVTRDFNIISNYDAILLNNAKEPTKKNYLFPDEIERKGKYLPLMKDCPHLKQGDMVLLYEDEKDRGSIDWSDLSELKKRVYFITGLSSMLVKDKYEFGVISLVKHNKSRVNAKFKKGLFKAAQPEPFIENLHSQINGIKIKLNILGIPEALSND